MILVQIPVFYSVKTVGGGNIQPLDVNHMCPGASNAMDPTRLSIIGREHGITKKTLILICQGLLQRKVSFFLILSNVSTAKGDYQADSYTCSYWHNHFNKIRHSKNNRNSKESEYSNVEIMLSLG